MPETTQSLVEFLNKVPPPEEVERRLCENLREAKLLRQILRIARRRQEVKEVSCK